MAKEAISNEAVEVVTTNTLKGIISKIQEGILKPNCISLDNTDGILYLNLELITKEEY